MKAQQKSMSKMEQILAILVLIVVGLVITAYAGGFVADNLAGDAQTICKCVMAIVGDILMWLIMIDFTVERILKLE